MAVEPRRSKPLDPESSRRGFPARKWTSRDILIRLQDVGLYTAQMLSFYEECCCYKQSLQLKEHRRQTTPELQTFSPYFDHLPASKTLKGVVIARSQQERILQTPKSNYERELDHRCGTSSVTRGWRHWHVGTEDHFLLAARRWPRQTASVMEETINSPNARDRVHCLTHVRPGVECS